MFKKSFEYLIVGLGNPGLQYEKTRHNIGFMCMEKIVEEYGSTPFKNKFDALVAETSVAGKRCMLCKPQTYMNDSGKAVSAICNFYKIPANKIIVIFDDTTLKLGQLRIRRGGTHGGHNGIKDIIELVGTTDIPRIKIGIGERPNQDYDLKDWVLGKFSADDRKLLDESFKKAAKAVECIIDDSVDSAMNKFNG